MNLLTPELRQYLLENGNPDNRDKDHLPVVKLFLPETACTWLLSELDYEDPTIAFGLCDLGMGFPELGCVSLEELQQLRSPLLKLQVERDLHFEAKYPLSIYAKAALMCRKITEDEIFLALAGTIKRNNDFRP